MKSEIPAYTLRHTFTLLGRVNEHRADIKELIRSEQIKTFVGTERYNIFVPEKFWLAQGPKCFNFQTHYEDSCAEIYLPHLFEYLSPSLKSLHNAIVSGNVTSPIELPLIDFKFQQLPEGRADALSTLRELSQLFVELIDNSQVNLAVYCKKDDVDRFIEFYRQPSGAKRGPKPRTLDKEFWITLMKFIYDNKDQLNQESIKTDMRDWCVKKQLDSETYSSAYVDDRVEDVWRALSLAQNRKTSK